jgi:hypothetical protein
VTPDSVRLSISDGDWIEVKKELNVGEQRRIFARLVKSMEVGQTVKLDPEQVGRSKVVEYLIGWSLTDAKGKPVPVTEGAIDSMDADTFKEIREAIEAHEETQDAAREAAKNAQAGESK